jgi:hypothetical protein
MSGDVRRCNVHGMFIKTEHEAPVGFVLGINIVMPWGEIACTAVPRFFGDTPDGRGMGLEFHLMDPADRQMWNTYYRKTLERATDAVRTTRAGWSGV